MAVNLEELALKSIEQYAALNVKMSSLEVAVNDMNRRAESSQDKFSLACDKLSRLEEKISSWVEDRKLIHNRIDDTRVEVDKLVELVRELTNTVKDHKDDHCDNCMNSHRVEELEDAIKNAATKDQVDELSRKLTEVSTVDKNLIKVRDMITTPQGMIMTRFITSKWSVFAASIVCIDLILQFYAHYSIISNLWNWMHFSN